MTSLTHHLARFAGVAVIAAGLFSAGGCDTPNDRKDAGKDRIALADKAGPKDGDTGRDTAPQTAVATVQGAGDHKDKITGTVTFVQRETGQGVDVLVDIKGLTPGKHGFHIHEKADLSDPKLEGAGPHWNPDGHKHGGPGDGTRHAGDLGNITADDKGHAKQQLIAKGITVRGEKDGVVGRSVIIHEKEDDLKTDPGGNSGARIAGGVIALKPSDKTEKK